MPMKKYKPQQIVMLLSQIEVEITNGKTTSQALPEYPDHDAESSLSATRKLSLGHQTRLGEAKGRWCLSGVVEPRWKGR